MDQDKLKLDGPTAANIFRGAIFKWNDPAIAKLNPGVSLPNLAITVAHRSDGSGTTYAFINYLARQSTDVMREVGAGKHRELASQCRWRQGQSGCRWCCSQYPQLRLALPTSWPSLIPGAGPGRCRN